MDARTLEATMKVCLPQIRERLENAAGSEPHTHMDQNSFADSGVNISCATDGILDELACCMPRTRSLWLGLSN
jgi:hypothetical protein